MKKPKICKRCGKKVKSLSARGLCHQCSTNAILQNIKSLKEHKGRSWENWRRGMLLFLKKLEEEK